MAISNLDFLPAVIYNHDLVALQIASYVNSGTFRLRIGFHRLSLVVFSLAHARIFSDGTPRNLLQVQVLPNLDASSVASCRSLLRPFGGPIVLPAALWGSGRRDSCVGEGHATIDGALNLVISKSTSDLTVKGNNTFIFFEREPVFS